MTETLELTSDMVCFLNYNLCSSKCPWVSDCPESATQEECENVWKDKYVEYRNRKARK